jgi:hypothetical protein
MEKKNGIRLQSLIITLAVLQVAVYRNTNGNGEHDGTTDSNENNVDGLEGRRRLDQSRAVIVVLLLGVLALANTVRVGGGGHLVGGDGVAGLAVAHAHAVGAGGVPGVAAVGAVVTGPDRVVLRGLDANVPRGDVVGGGGGVWWVVVGQHELVDVATTDAVVVGSERWWRTQASVDRIGDGLGLGRDAGAHDLRRGGDRGVVDLVDREGAGVGRLGAGDGGRVERARQEADCLARGAGLVVGADLGRGEQHGGGGGGGSVGDANVQGVGQRAGVLDGDRRAATDDRGLRGRRGQRADLCRERQARVGGGEHLGGSGGGGGGGLHRDAESHRADGRVVERWVDGKVDRRRRRHVLCGWRLDVERRGCLAGSTDLAGRAHAALHIEHERGVDLRQSAKVDVVVDTGLESDILHRGIGNCRCESARQSLGGRESTEALSCEAHFGGDRGVVERQQRTAGARGDEVSAVDRLCREAHRGVRCKAADDRNADWSGKACGHREAGSRGSIESILDLTNDAKVEWCTIGISSKDN